MVIINLLTPTFSPAVAALNDTEIAILARLGRYYLSDVIVLNKKTKLC